MIHRFGIKCLLRAGRVFYQSIYALAIRENTVMAAQVRKLNLLRLMMSVLLRTMPAFSKIVTAACPYPALRLDKLYAALIRCLVLWTVTKQFLVSCFKGLYLLA